MLIKKIALYIFVFLCFSCGSSRQEKTGFIITDDFPVEKILEKGTLDIATFYNTTDYYIYKGITRGFHYELAKDFADFLGVDLHIVEVDNNIDAAIDKLYEGKYDLLAVSLTETPERKEKVCFTDPFFTTGEVLVQNNRNKLLKDLEELDGKDIYVLKDAAINKILLHLQDSLNIRPNIIYVEHFSYEDILHLVNIGEIDYTVIDGNIAQAAALSMKHLDHSLSLNDNITVAWGVSTQNSLLNEAINQWLALAKKDSKFNFLFNRYFNNRNSVSQHNSKYSVLKKGGISPFDNLLKKESKRLGWDWRLLAAVVYIESQFNPESESPYGAYGLMQVLPETADLFHVQDYFTPDSNIYVGVRYLKYLDDLYQEQIKDPWERLKFTLASYNAGAGHVRDAMRLTEKYQKDPYKWDNNVAYYLLNKSKPEFYQDPLSRNGYCNGKQATEYVRRTLETYNHYKNISSQR